MAGPAWWWLAGVGVTAGLPFLLWQNPYILYLGGTAFLFAALASAWNLLATAGPISFGHAAFFGLGAYTSVLLSTRAGLPIWVTLPLAGIVGALGALPMGISAQWLRGPYLALATLAWAEIYRLLAMNWTGLTGGGSGLIGIPPLGNRLVGYYAGLGLLTVVFLASLSILRSRVGLAFVALRESEDRARTLGVPATAYRLLAFALSGGLTALCGGVYAHTVRFIEPDLVFGRYYSILPLVMATFGGAYTLLGPIVGTLSLYLVSELLFLPYLPSLHQLPYALALVAVVFLLPRGLASLITRP